MQIARHLGLNALVLFCVFTLNGCDRFAEKTSVDDLRGTVAVLQNRVANLEVRALASATATAAPAPANWVLWKRDQHLCSNCLWSPPRPVSAYSSRSECVIAASNLIPPGGQAVSTDPIEIVFGQERRLFFHCLPPGTDASK